MKKPQIQNDRLGHFIKLFLPEGKVENKIKFELMTVSKLIIAILNSINKDTNEESIFNTFYNLHYAMSVIEPLQQSKPLKPYIDTNSHAIYIGIDPDKLGLLNKYLNFLLAKKSGLPIGLQDIDRSLRQFKL